MFTEKALLGCTQRLTRYAKYLCFKDHNKSIEVEDLVQTVLERAIRYQEKFVPGNLQHWLCAMLYHEYITQMRARERRSHCNIKIAQILADYVPDPSQRSDLNVIISDIESSIEELPDMQKEILDYMMFNDNSYSKCAIHLNIPVGTVRSRLSRARSTLRKKV